jgi:hypothetical protein
VIVNTNLFVEASPGLGPGKFNWLNFLVEERAGLCGNEEVGFSIFTDMSATTAGVDLVLSVGTQFSFRNHF